MYESFFVNCGGKYFVNGVGEGVGRGVWLGLAPGNGRILNEDWLFWAVFGKILGKASPYALSSTAVKPIIRMTANSAKFFPILLLVIIHYYID